MRSNRQRAHFLLSAAMRHHFLVAVIALHLSAIACAQADGFHPQSGLRLSADRSSVIASVRMGGTPAIYELSLTNQPARRITSGADVSPVSSPDELYVAFARIKENSRQGLWLLDRSNGRERALTNSDGHEDGPAFIDARTIVFVRAHRQRGTSTGGTHWIDWDLYTINVVTGAERRITNKAFSNVTKPTWEPTQKKILLSAAEAFTVERPVLVDL